MPKLDEYLRIKEAAEYLGVARNTLRNWEAAGKIPVYRLHEECRRVFRIKKEGSSESCVPVGKFPQTLGFLPPLLGGLFVDRVRGAESAFSEQRGIRLSRPIRP